MGEVEGAMEDGEGVGAGVAGGDRGSAGGSGDRNIGWQAVFVCGAGHTGWQE